MPRESKEFQGSYFLLISDVYSIFILGQETFNSKNSHMFIHTESVLVLVLLYQHFIPGKAYTIFILRQSVSLAFLTLFNVILLFNFI